MSLFGSRNSPSSEADDLQDIAAQYRRLSPIRFRLNHEIVSRLPGDVLEEGAKKLGILRGGVFVFGTEDETSVLMDYCIYDVYRKGRNAVAQYLADCPPDAASDEMTCLHAMRDATYTVVAVLRVEPGVGCHVRNLSSGKTRLLADVGLSKTAVPGAVFATRLLDFGRFVSTGGAVIPMGVLKDIGVDEFEREIRGTLDDDRFDPAPFIRSCLGEGMSSRVRYEGADTPPESDGDAGPPPARNSAERRRMLAKHHAGRAAMNRRCRCGSGKMFKNCCANRGGVPGNR